MLHTLYSNFHIVHFLGYVNLEDEFVHLQRFIKCLMLDSE